MTWQQWVNSSYNTSGYEIQGTDVIKRATETSYFVVKLNNINVVSSNQIKSNTSYTTVRQSSSGGGNN